MGKQTKKKEYRLTLSDNLTHEEIRSLRFTRTVAICTGVAAAMLLVGLIFALIALTPVRTVIPGYPDAHAQKTAVANAIKIDSLESTIARWELYAENLSRVLSGEQTISLDSIMKGNAVRYLSGKSREEAARQDSLLRESVDATRDEPGSSRPLPLEGMHFFTPLKGVVSNSYDAAVHPAIDITAPVNSVVCAALDGTVVGAMWSDAELYTLILQHAGEAITIYSRCGKLLKNRGEKVKAGAPIALVGESPESLTAGDHLQFELWYKGESEDPMKYISF